MEDIFWVHCGEGGSLSGARAVSGVGQATAYRWLEARFIALRDAGMPRAAAARQLRLSRSRCEAWELKRRQSQILLGPLSLTAMPDQAAHLATAVFQAMMRAEVSHDGEG